MISLITGASSGIGYSTVVKLSELPGTIIAVARNKSMLDSLKEHCLKTKSLAKVVTIPIDLSLETSFSKIESMLSGEVDSLDVLINNAGYLVNKPFQEISPEELSQTYRTNVFAPFLLSRQLLPLLTKGNNPQIINIGSMGGMNGTTKFSGLTAYSSSKGALSVFSECLAQELANIGIRVNCLAIGSVNTEMLKAAFPGYRSTIESKDMAEFIVNFTLNDSKFFNGKTIPVSSSTP